MIRSNLGTASQAKSDNLGAQDRLSRGNLSDLRRVGRALRDLCRNPRVSARDVRESQESRRPRVLLCSANVLFDFLHLSFGFSP